MRTGKILLVGSGQLGTRHLQAVATLPGIREIHVVDPVEESLALGKARLQEINDRNPAITFFWHQKITTRAAHGDLCIIATQAQGRCALIKDIVEQLEYKNFLIEKVVAQSVDEYEDIMEFCKKSEVAVWVNCKTRAYGIHQYIKSKLDPKDPISLTRVGGNHGLATNGVHTADLFQFYDGSQYIHPVAARIDQKIHHTKRGQYDLSGALYGSTDKGSDLVISYSRAHESADIITIVSPRGRFIVDHSQKFATESCPEHEWRWRPIAINERWEVSDMTKIFALDILKKGTCDLPTVSECFPAHEFILRALLPHFNQLLGTQSSRCPVT